MGSLLPNETLCLRYNDYSTNLKSAFCDSRLRQDFCDVCLITKDGGCIKAHKIILSASSKFFRDTLQDLQTCNIPTVAQQVAIFVRGVSKSELERIVQFIYQGEVNVSNEHLAEFLALADELKIKGLANQQYCHQNDNTTEHVEKDQKNKRASQKAQKNSNSEDQGKFSSETLTDIKVETEETDEFEALIMSGEDFEVDDSNLKSHEDQNETFVGPPGYNLQKATKGSKRKRERHSPIKARHRARTSTVWKFYTDGRRLDGKRTSVCKTCFQDISIVASSTTLMWRHLKLVHPDLYEICMAEEAGKAQM